MTKQLRYRETMRPGFWRQTNEGGDRRQNDSDVWVKRDLETTQPIG